MSVCSSVCVHETTLIPLDELPWNLTYDYLSKTCRENSALFKIWQKSRILFVRDVYTCVMLFRSTLRRRRNVSDKDCRENQNTFCGQYTFPENRAVCAITCKNAEKLEKLLMKIYYGACSLHTGYLRYSHTLICNTYCFFTAAVATGTHLNVTFISTLPTTWGSVF
jgi:hypothetical protein